VNYCATNIWEKSACLSWDQKQHPHGLLSFQQNIYLCQFESNIVIYNTSGNIIQENSSVKSPSGIDIDEKNSLLYIAGATRVAILNLKLEFRSSWDLPEKNYAGFRGLKVDGKTVYLTIEGLHKVYFCNSQDGTKLKELGTEKELGTDWHSPDKFYFPSGLTTDKKHLYICDEYNHRVQIFTKENGIYVSTWRDEDTIRGKGKFDRPVSIYNYSLEDLIYVGDSRSVQIFWKNGICIQSLGIKKAERG